MSPSSGDAQFDFDREVRIGLPEALFAEGKTPAQIAEIVAENRERGHRLLLTRLSPDTHAQIPAATGNLLDYDPASQTAILGTNKIPCAPTSRD